MIHTTPESVSIGTSDGVRLESDFYPAGTHWICLFHGKRFDKNVWRGFADELQRHGYGVLAPNFRGYGNSGSGEADATGRFDLDVAAVLAYAQAAAMQVSAIGASMAGPALLEGLCRLDRPIAHAILLSPAWEPAGGYACLHGKAADALIWYGEREPYRDACAAIGEHLPFPVSSNVQASALHAHAYFADPEFAPRLQAHILETLARPAQGAPYPSETPKP